MNCLTVRLTYLLTHVWVDNSSKDGSFVGREYIPGEGTKGGVFPLIKKQVGVIIKK